jgi:hypothetical protein
MYLKFIAFKSEVDLAEMNLQNGAESFFNCDDMDISVANMLYSGDAQISIESRKIYILINHIQCNA